MRDRDAGIAVLVGLALLVLVKRTASGALKHQRLVWYWAVPGAPTSIPIPMWVASDFKADGLDLLITPAIKGGFYRAEDSETDRTMDDSRGGYIEDWGEFWRTAYPSWAQRNIE